MTSTDRDLFHPETIATARAHANRTPGSCANDDRDHEPRRPCDCRPDPADLAAVWDGRRRMAVARRDAGRPLDDVDRQALDRRPEGSDARPS